MSEKDRNPIVWIVYNDGVRDFGRAEKFGDLKSIVSGHYRTGFAKDSSNMIDYMREVMRGYQPHDYILMVGEPALCGIAITIAREMCTEVGVTILRWDNHAMAYEALDLKLSPLELVPTREEFENSKETQSDFNIK